MKQLLSKIRLRKTKKNKEYCKMQRNSNKNLPNNAKGKTIWYLFFFYSKHLHRIMRKSIIKKSNDCKIRLTGFNLLFQIISCRYQKLFREMDISGKVNNSKIRQRSRKNIQKS